MPPLMELPIKEQRWSLILLFCLVGFLSFFAWLNRPAQCLDSEVIRRLEWRSGPQPFDVYRCRARVRIGYQDRLADGLLQLNHRLGVLDEVGTYYLGVDWKPANFVVEIVDPEVLGERLSDHRIFISPDQLFHSQELERQILSRSLRQSLAFPEQPAAFLIARYLLGLTGYGPQNILPGSPDWKLSLYAEAVDHARRGKSLGQQNEIFVAWWSLLKSREAKAWIVPEELAPGLHSALASSGYCPEKKLFQLPFAVLWTGQDLKFAPHEWTEIQKLLAAVIEPHQIRLPFSPVAFSRLNMEPLQVGRLVLFRCGLPRLDELENLGIQFEHLLVVQDCDSPDPRKIVASLLSPKNFARDYPGIDFIQIHWPSLQLAMKKTGHFETSLTAFLQPEALENFKQIGYLTSLDRDTTTGISSWKGALQPFPLFRLRDLGPRGRETL